MASNYKNNTTQNNPNFGSTRIKGSPATPKTEQRESFFLSDFCGGMWKFPKLLKNSTPVKDIKPNKPTNFGAY